MADQSRSRSGSDSFLRSASRHRHAAQLTSRAETEEQGTCDGCRAESAESRNSSAVSELGQRPAVSLTPHPSSNKKAKLRPREEVDKEQEVINARAGPPLLDGSRVDGETLADADCLSKSTDFCAKAEVPSVDEGGEAANKRKAPSPSPSPLLVDVLREEIPRVIGHRGATVMGVERESGVRIFVNKASGRLHLSGDKAAQDRALHLLLKHVTYAKTDAVLKDEHSSAMKSVKVEGDAPSCRLLVKVQEVGRVIGRGGETVQKIIEKTGADIQVQQRHDEKTGEILILGEPEQREKAKEAISNLVSWSKEVGETDSRKATDRRPRSKEESAREELNKKQRTSSRSGLWVCTQCGGDHRGKDCPHSRFMWGAALHMGVQMGMQAIGMQQMQARMRMASSVLGAPQMGLPGLNQPTVRGESAKSKASGSASGTSSDSDDAKASRRRRHRGHGVSLRESGDSWEGLQRRLKMLERRR